MWEEVSVVLPSLGAELHEMLQPAEGRRGRREARRPHDHHVPLGGARPLLAAARQVGGSEGGLPTEGRPGALCRAGRCGGGGQPRRQKVGCLRWYWIA